MIRISASDLDDPRTQERLREELTRIFHGSFDLLSRGGKVGECPTLRQKSTGLLFQLIPSGEFVMGLTEKEEGAARRIRDPIPVDIREMRPAVKMEVEAFLMTSAPITSRVFRRFASEAPTGVQFTDEPVFVSFDQAMRFATSIDCSL